METRPENRSEASRLAEEVLGEVVDKSRADSTATGRPAGGRTRLLAGAAALAVVLLVVVRIGAGPIAPAPEEAGRQIRGDLMLMVEDLETYRRQHRSYPTSLSKLPDVDEAYAAEYDYQRLAPDRYQISLATNGQTVQYDSAVQAATFFADVADVRD